MTAPIHFRAGEIWGLPIMKFTLTFEGCLPPSANKSKAETVWSIRQHFHPQLIDLWESHPTLLGVLEQRMFPLGPGTILLTGGHHSKGVRRTIAAGTSGGQKIDLCAAIEKHGVQFLPLVRETFALHCGLKITFLRKEAPGRVYQGGDLDGRIKTLVDALAMPQHKEQVFKTDATPAPIYCLLEDDAMVSGLEVQSERLLTDQNHPKDYVRLMIEVDVRVREARAYNLPFLG
ncbi:MAG: hypothetical protein KDA48_07700 [Amphiplicatus sp.]|nr:hypothetical protein [Amphiplicatus sp.]HRX40204.1 hypothetical protein [Parvularculaceae bacterium]